jgi:hypothetical protein
MKLREESGNKLKWAERIKMSTASFLRLPYDVQELLFWYTLCDDNSDGGSLSMDINIVANLYTTFLSFVRMQYMRFSCLLASFARPNRSTFVLDLSHKFEPKVLCGPLSHDIRTLTIVVTNVASFRLPAILSFTLTMAKQPHWINVISNARVLSTFHVCCRKSYDVGDVVRRAVLSRSGR